MMTAFFKKNTTVRPYQFVTCTLLLNIFEHYYELFIGTPIKFIKNPNSLENDNGIYFG